MRVKRRNQNYSCENHEIVLLDFSRAGCPSCYLIAGEMGVGEGGVGGEGGVVVGEPGVFARSNMSSLIEAVSRSARGRRSNRVIM